RRGQWAPVAVREIGRTQLPGLEDYSHDEGLKRSFLTGLTSKEALGAFLSEVGRKKNFRISGIGSVTLQGGSPGVPIESLRMVLLLVILHRIIEMKRRSKVLVATEIARENERTRGSMEAVRRVGAWHRQVIERLIEQLDLAPELELWRDEELLDRRIFQETERLRKEDPRGRTGSFGYTARQDVLAEVGSREGALLKLGWSVFEGLSLEAALEHFRIDRELAGGHLASSSGARCEFGFDRWRD